MTNEPKIKVAIVILNWNGQKFLEQFLPIVLINSLSPDYRIIIVDNGSSDASIELLNEKFPQVSIIELNKNYGFAEGYNRAITQINSEYSILLNSDVEVSPGWIEPIINLMDKENKVAACMPKILSFYNRDNFEYAGAAGGFIDKFGYPFCRGRILKHIEKDNHQFDNTVNIFWATGACMFIRTELFINSGGFDSDFFAHMEEIDLCWRLKNQGYKILCVPESVIFHIGGGTLPNENPRKLFLNYRNNLLLLFKNLPDSQLITTLLIRMIFDSISALVYLGNLSFAHFFIVIKAHIAFYRLLPKFIIKRRILKNSYIKYDHPEILKKSIVYNYFIKKNKNFNHLDFT